MVRIDIWNDNLYTDNFKLYFEAEEETKPDSIILTRYDDDKNNAPEKWVFPIVDKGYIDEADSVFQSQIDEINNTLTEIQTEIETDICKFITGSNSLTIGSLEPGTYQMTATATIHTVPEKTIPLTGICYVSDTELTVNTFRAEKYGSNEGVGQIVTEYRDGTCLSYALIGRELFDSVSSPFITISNPVFAEMRHLKDRVINLENTQVTSVRATPSAGGYTTNTLVTASGGDLREQITTPNDPVIGFEHTTTQDDTTLNDILHTLTFKTYEGADVQVPIEWKEYVYDQNTEMGKLIDDTISYIDPNLPLGVYEARGTVRIANDEAVIDVPVSGIATVVPVDGSDITKTSFRLFQTDNAVTGVNYVNVNYEGERLNIKALMSRARFIELEEPTVSFFGMTYTSIVSDSDSVSHVIENVSEAETTYNLVTKAGQTLEETIVVPSVDILRKAINEGEQRRAMTLDATYEIYRLPQDPTGGHSNAPLYVMARYLSWFGIYHFARRSPTSLQFNLMWTSNGEYPTPENMGLGFFTDETNNDIVIAVNGPLDRQFSVSMINNMTDTSAPDFSESFGIIEPKIELSYSPLPSVPDGDVVETGALTDIITNVSVLPSYASYVKYGKNMSVYLSGFFPSEVSAATTLFRMNGTYAPASRVTTQLIAVAFIRGEPTHLLNFTLGGSGTVTFRDDITVAGTNIATTTEVDLVINYIIS